MKKTFLLLCCAIITIAMFIGSSAAPTGSYLANSNPNHAGDLLSADTCPDSTIFGQEPTDCDGSWALVTSDSDLGYFAYDDYEVFGEIQSLHFWGGDLLYSGGWYECDEDPITFNIYFCPDNGYGAPNEAYPVCSYTITSNHDPTAVCSLSGVYEVWEWDFELDPPCNLLSGWVGIQGIGNGDTCVFMWYNSQEGYGYNSWQNGDYTDYQQAFCLSGEQVPDTPKISGSICTSDKKGISEKRLKKLLKDYVYAKAPHSVLLALTECYGGDMIASLKRPAGTAIISATSPCQTAKYGCYHRDAAGALKPDGKDQDGDDDYDSDDVHQKGIDSKHWSETPKKDGDPVSLEGVDPVNGPIKSRHILVYGGITNGLDRADRDDIKRNFAGEPNTTVTTVGTDKPPVVPNDWDHPGTEKGLTDALKVIKPQLDSTEQFILFVTDHGDKDAVDDVCDETSPGTYESGPMDLGSAYEPMLTEPDNEAAVTIFVEQETQPGPCDIQVGSQYFYSVPCTLRVDIDDDGMQDPGDGWECRTLVDETLLDSLSGDSIIVSNLPSGTAVSALLTSGAIPRGFPDSCLTCDAISYSPRVPNIDGEISWDFTVCNCSPDIIPVYAEMYPTIGDCASGTQYDFNLIKQISASLQPGDCYTGYYYYHIDEVTGITDAALSFNIGPAVNNWWSTCCFEFVFSYPWGRLDGPPSWGTPGKWLGQGADVRVLPTFTSLGRNYPNPFNATTAIPFDLAVSGDVSLKIYNVTGQLVETLADGYLQAGEHGVTWDASTYSSGIYFYKLTTGDFTQTRKMNLIK